MIFGFIGSGNMGGAIIGGIINSDIASPENVIVSDKNEQALKNINEKYGVKVTSDNKETADKADVLFLCVKRRSFIMAEEKKFRTEHDSIGTKEVPVEAYYGVQTLRAAENFYITGLNMHDFVLLAHLPKCFI